MSGQGHRPTLKPGRTPRPPDPPPAGASPRPADVRITDALDVAAVVAAADRLTTQLRRIADALEPAVAARADDAPPRRGQPSIPHLIARAAVAAAQPRPLPFTCPVCRRTSHHPEDAKNGYCGNCHAFTGTPEGDDSV